jgi:hypothetical protein
MVTPPTQLNKASKVVVGCQDGQRLKGFVFNFSPLREVFRLFPEESSPHHLGTDVKLEGVKAIFFVKDFTGHREHQDAYDLGKSAHGRKLEVIFQDGEIIAGTTEAYNPRKVGFFLFPADPESNNMRIFVVNRSVQEVKLL